MRASIELAGTELWPEIRRLQGEKTVEMVLSFARQWPNIRGEAQKGDPTYYPRRTPSENKLDPDKTVAEQFDQLRVCDNARFPAWFEYRGRRYKLEIGPF